MIKKWIGIRVIMVSANRKSNYSKKLEIDRKKK